MTTESDDPTPEELAEATALAEALDTGRISEGLPGDALEVAAMLRYRADPDLDPARAKQIADELADVPVRPAPRRARYRSLLGALGLGLTAAAAFALHEATTATPSAPMALPMPSAELLEAQAALASGDATASSRLHAEMTAYRVTVYQAMHERYRR